MKRGLETTNDQQSAWGITLDKLHKQFGSAVAVNKLDLKIEPGEFVSLLGPSGCGKTTTLRMLAGLEFPTSGSINFGERDVTNVAPAQRDIAMVFQSYALYPHMTVADNIAYPLKKRGVPKAERPAMVESVARLLQLEQYLNRKPRQLSGGQQQRVALGRALVRKPAIFLLDEPLSNLDAKLRAHMRAELIELHRKIGKTMVYVTHDQLEAMTMSTRIAVMNKGNLQQFATPSTIYEAPANVFVAEFIGTPAMTLLDADLHWTGKGPEVRLGPLTIPLEASHVERESRDPLAIKLGIRPEDIYLDDKGFPATVKLIEPTGHESIVQLLVADALITARVPAHVHLEQGQGVRVAFRSMRLHLFDRASGWRLPAKEP
ncbi:MAG: ABC transporter ATP-binding protein [Rhizobiaceae bacterium]|nr:ABC transporter ATP-binding protein [Rhizobiaceae bacterium]